MITNYVINCGYKHNTFKNEIFLLDKNIKLKYQAEGLNVSVYSTTDNIDRIYFNEIEYSQSSNDYGKYRFENNLTITFYENPNISFYDIIKKIVIKDYYLILKDYKNNYFLVNADNGYDLTYKISISDNSEEINTLTIEIKSVSNHPLMIFNDFKFNIINFSEKPCDYIDNSINSIKWSTSDNLLYNNERGFTIHDLSKLYNIDYLEDSFSFVEEMDEDGAIETTIKLNIPIVNSQFSFLYNLMEYSDNRYKMFFITNNGNLYTPSGKLSVRYDIAANLDSPINYATLTFSSTNNMFNSGSSGNGNNEFGIWIVSDDTKCEGYNLYNVAYKYILVNNELIKTDTYKVISIVEENTCECGYYDSFTEWIIGDDIVCGSDLGEGYETNSLYIERIRYGICNGEINYDLIFTEYLKMEGITCDDCINPSISDWIATDEYMCGFILGDDYIQNAKYQKYQKVLLCNNVPTSNMIDEQWQVYEEYSSDCLFPPIYKYNLVKTICDEENLPTNIEIVDEKPLPSWGIMVYKTGTDIKLFFVNYINNCNVVQIKQEDDTWKTEEIGNNIYNVPVGDVLLSFNNLTDLSNIFNNSNNLLKANLNNFDTSNITDMWAMFRDCNSLTSLDVSNFNTSKVANMSSMFNNCSSLISLNISNFDTSNVTDMRSMFVGCSSLTSLDVNNFDTSNVKNMSSMFYGCSSLISLNVSNFNTIYVSDMGSMFENCSSLTSLDLSNFNTSNVTDMGYMFNNCSLLTSLDVSNFNTFRVTDMSSMFGGCNSLTSLNLSNFNTINVKNMSSMFSGCNLLTSLDVSNFNTSKVANMGSMFGECSSLTSLDLSNFNTFNVTDMSSMFWKCNLLASLDVSNFNTINVKNMSHMFENCSSLISLDLSNFDTSKVTNMDSMFNNCSSLTSLNLSNFDASKVNYSNSMFWECNNLTYIKCKQAFKDWCITNQDIISLPTAMREGGGGTWEIVG